MVTDKRKKNSRPRIGITKKVSITLPAEEWELIISMEPKSLSEYFRDLQLTQSPEVQVNIFEAIKRAQLEDKRA